MAKFEWTPEQKKAIEAKGNILVSAAAGAGKTGVLSERIAQLVKNGADIDRMLIITFTRAAAAEMKNRIEDRLTELAGKLTDEKDDALRDYLYRQASLCGNAHISTIDSFCSYLFRRHFYTEGYSRSTSIGDEAVIEDITRSAVNTVCDRYFKEHPQSDLYTVFGGEKSFIEAVGTLLEKMRSKVNGREWLQNAVEKYNSDFFTPDSPDAGRLLGSVSELVRAAKGINELLRTVSADDKFDAALDSNDEYFDRIIDAPTIPEKKAILDTRPKSIPTCKGTPFEGVVAALKELQKKPRETAKNLIGDVSCTNDVLSAHYPYVKLLSELVFAAEDELAEQKKKKNVIDFTDLAHFVIKLLSDEETARVYSERFDYVFIDEYQDTAPVQDASLSNIRPANGTFYVGDVKQSIYRFRNAEPRLFLHKMREFSDDSDSHVFSLMVNHRCSDAVVNFTNAVMNCIMTEKTGGVNYRDGNALIKPHEDNSGSIEVYVTDREKKDTSSTDTDESIEELSAAQEQARVAAAKIKELYGTEFYDRKNDTMRKFRYSDFAILMTSVKTKGEYFMRELSAAGIPVYTESDSSIFDSLEVTVFTNLLRVIDNRHLDIPLISIMRSPVGGFTMTELSNMRAYAVKNAVDGKYLDMYDTVKFAAESGENEKAALFLAKLERWYGRSRICPINVLVQLLLSESGYYRFVSALPNGKRRCANLDMISGFANERRGSFGVHDFLAYLDRASEYMKDASPREAASDAVTMTTIHKSKGLEYGIVIIPGMEGELITNVPGQKKILSFGDQSIGAKLVMPDGESDNIYFRLNEHTEKLALYADRMRLLYVALTRAKERIILILSSDDPKKLLTGGTGLPDDDGADCLPKSSSDFVRYFSSRFCDWIFYALRKSEYADALSQAAVCGEGRTEKGDFTCRVLKKEDIKPQTGGITEDEFRAMTDRLKNSACDESENAAEWEYPYADVSRLPSKGSVTGFAHVQEFRVRTGASRNETESISATDRGTAVHLVFELIPLTRHTKESVEKFVASLEESGLLTEDEAKAVNSEQIAAFFTRPTYERMLQSERVLREQGFACFVPADMLIEGCESDEPVLVQGVIDCCFIENGKWIILDYKTDRVSPDKPDEVQKKAQSHAKQLRLYAYVLEKLTGIPVSECLISFTNAYECRVI